jgi:hypothetical protein
MGKGGLQYFLREIDLFLSSGMVKMKKKNMPKKFITDKRIGRSLILSEELLIWRTVATAESEMAAAIDAIYPHQGIPCGWKPAKGQGRGVVSVYRP